MERSPSSVEEHLSDIPLQLATFHQFKQKLINQSAELKVTTDAINKVMGVVKSQFILPLAQTIDRVLVNAKTHLVLRTESENYKKRISELENQLKQFTPVAEETKKAEELTMATPQKKTPETPKRIQRAKRAPIEDRQFYNEQLVETVIRYGSEQEIWIDATINGFNQDDETYNLYVLDPETFKVNPEAVHVPENLIRNKKRKLVKRRSTKKRKKPAIDLLNEADSSGKFGSSDIVAQWSTKKAKPMAEPTSGDMGCYLTIKITGDKFLMLNWSKEPVPGAFLFFRPRKKVPGFKFKNNKGREELMRDVNQKRFYMGCLNFFKLAQQFEADIVQMQGGFDDDETWPVKFIINNDTFLFPIPRFEFFDTSYCQNVVCVHAANSTFDGVSKQPIAAFLTTGNNAGYASQLKPKKVGKKKMKKRKSRKKL